MVRFRFRDKLVLAFIVVLLVTVVPVLILVNTQIDTISERKIEKDLRTTRTVFQRYQEGRLVSYSEKTRTFILTQPEIRAEIATAREDTESLFGDVFTAPPAGAQGGAGPTTADPFAPPAGRQSAGPTAADPFAPRAGRQRAGPTAADPFAPRAGRQSAGPTAADPFAPPAGRQSAAPTAADPFAPRAQGGSGRAGAGASAGGGASGAAGLPERQNRILSVVEEVGLYKESQVFFLADERGRLIFSKVNPRAEDTDLTHLPSVYRALQGNEVFTWWGSREKDLAPLGLLPGDAGTPRLYQMFLKPVVFGGEVKGLIGIGFALSADDLANIIGITQAEIAFIADGSVYVNSLAAIPDATLVGLAAGAGQQAGDHVLRFSAGAEDYLALQVPMQSTLGEPVGSVVVYRSKTREKQVFDNLKTILNAIGLAALAVAGMLAYLISHNVSAVVRELFAGVSQVRQGNLEVRLAIRSRDEFGELGRAFNEMTAGLKEKEAIRDTFKRYVSSSVVDELLRNVDGIKLGGEHKVLTIQFSDIAGFTALSEALSPEGVVEFLNEYLTEMTAEVEAEGGIVDKYIGDAVMAFWGAPMPLDDHPARACRAALRQVRKVAELRRRWAERGDLSRFSIRLGLHTGGVIVGNIGSATRMDYTIIGDAVNTASRLEGLNKLYGTTILVSEPVRRQAGDAFLTREVDLIRPVGKSEPVRIFELLGFAGEAARLAPGHRRFAEGLALYRERRFPEALAAFRAAEAGEGAEPDTAAGTYIARCLAYLDNPPPPSWDGVYVSTSK